MNWLLTGALWWSTPIGAATFRPDYPPFYTLTYEEAVSLKQPGYKGSADKIGPYLKEVNRLLRLFQLKQNPILIKSLSALEQASQSAERWNDLRKKIFDLCEVDPSRKAPQNQKVCAGFIKARRDAIEMGSRPGKED